MNIQHTTSRLLAISTAFFFVGANANETIKKNLRDIPFGQSIAVNIVSKQLNSNLANAGVAAGSQVLTELLKSKDNPEKKDLSELLCFGSQYFLFNAAVRASVNWSTSSIQGPIIEKYNAMEEGLIKDAIGATAPVVKEFGYNLITTTILAIIKAIANFNPCGGCDD